VDSCSEGFSWSYYGNFGTLKYNKIYHFEKAYCIIVDHKQHSYIINGWTINWVGNKIKITASVNIILVPYGVMYHQEYFITLSKAILISRTLFISQSAWQGDDFPSPPRFHRSSLQLSYFLAYPPANTFDSPTDSRLEKPAKQQFTSTLLPPSKFPTRSLSAFWVLLGLTPLHHPSISNHDPNEPPENSSGTQFLYSLFIVWFVSRQRITKILISL